MATIRLEMALAMYYGAQLERELSTPDMYQVGEGIGQLEAEYNDLLDENARLKRRIRRQEDNTVGRTNPDRIQRQRRGRNRDEDDQGQGEFIQDEVEGEALGAEQPQNIAGQGEQAGQPPQGLTEQSAPPAEL